MTVRESLDQVLAAMPEERLKQVLDFAEYLAFKADSESLREFGREQFARAYDGSEPEYDLTDVRER